MRADLPELPDRIEDSLLGCAVAIERDAPSVASILRQHAEELRQYRAAESSALRALRDAPVGEVAAFPSGPNCVQVGVRISAYEQCVWDYGQRVRLVAVENDNG